MSIITLEALLARSAAAQERRSDPRSAAAGLDEQAAPLRSGQTPPHPERGEREWDSAGEQGHAGTILASFEQHPEQGLCERDPLNWSASRQP